MDTWSSFVEAESTAENLDLMLDLGENGKVVGVNEDVPTVLERGQQIERFLEVIRYAVGWLLG